MTTRRVLNVSSTKKRDLMLSYSNVISPRNDANTSYALSPAFLQAVTGPTQNLFAFAWCATARNSTTTTEPTDRNSLTCYMRGLKERIEIQTNSGVPWQWRRICFTRKGAWFTPSTTFTPYSYTSNGYVRVVNQVPASSTLFADLFDGANTIDWNDVFAAKVNNNLVSVKYDKTVSIQSGNASGIVRVFSRWHGMNSNLTYADEEYGGDDSTAAYSTLGRKGMGDFYVVDLFQAGVGATSSDILRFNPHATLYWHEK